MGEHQEQPLPDQGDAQTQLSPDEILERLPDDVRALAEEFIRTTERTHIDPERTKALRRYYLEGVWERFKEGGFRMPPTIKPTEYQKIIAANIRREREDCDLTQAQLANAMERVGHPWKRQTVAEIENDLRKVSLEELVGLAALFGRPMVWFLLPWDGEYLGLPQGPIPSQYVTELVLGPDYYSLGPEESLAPRAFWSPSFWVARVGKEDWRPAYARYKARQEE